MISFMYDGRLDNLEDNAIELFKAADLYQVDGLTGKLTAGTLLYFIIY